MGNIIKIITKYGLHRLIPGRKRLYGLYVRYKLKGKWVAKVQGFKMAINPKEQDYSFLEAFYVYAINGVHELATTELFKKTVKKGDTVLDIGANMGYFSLLASKLCGRVICFEPEKKNFDYITHNIKLNKFKNIATYNKAVSDKSGKAILFVCPYDSGHNTLNQEKGIKEYRETKGTIKSYEVKTTSIDDIVGGKVDVVKIDVEGSELFVLKGMEKTLKRNHNIKLFIEFFPLLIDSMGCSPREMIELLQNQGFNIFVIPDYSLVGPDIIKIKDYDDLMGYCIKKDSHLNLYCQRQNEYQKKEILS